MLYQLSWSKWVIKLPLATGFEEGPIIKVYVQNKATYNKFMWSNSSRTLPHSESISVPNNLKFYIIIKMNFKFLFLNHLKQWGVFFFLPKTMVIVTQFLFLLDKILGLIGLFTSLINYIYTLLINCVHTSHW